MKTLRARPRNAVSVDPEATWFDAETPVNFEVAQDFFGFALATLPKGSYLNISNGRFSPGPLIGLAGGYESSWGDHLRI